MSHYTQTITVWLCLAILGVSGTNAASAADEYISPLALAADQDGKNIYVAEFTKNQVAVFNVKDAKVIKEIPLLNPPSGLVLSPDGSLLYVTDASVKGMVHIINLNNMEIAQSIPVGHTPYCPVISPDGKTLYVCNRFNNDISVIDLSSGKEITRISVLREPIAAAITKDGKYLYVANLLPAGRADANYISSEISVIETRTNKVVKNIQLPNGSTAIRGICISPDGKHIYATHILARYQMPTTQLERGWMNTNALTIIDASKQDYINTVLLDDIDLGAANPWGVSCTADGKFICVTHAGTHEVSVIDRDGLHEKLNKALEGYKFSNALNAMAYPDDVPNDLAFLVGLQRRLKFKGNGPRGLTIIGTKVYAAEYFSDSLGVLDIAQKGYVEVHSIPLGSVSNMSTIREGEMLFNNASLCFQSWQSCATCHLEYGRIDGLNWDLLNDGMGNPKSTKSLLLTHKTPPAMMTGIRDKAETAVRAGFKFIQFSQVPEENAAAVDEFLKSLTPIPSPYLSDGKLSEAAQKGQKVFEKAGCVSCHTAPLYTDMEKYNIGTGTGLEKNRDFDTPTLVEVWRTGPYLYDGRATTIKEVLTTYNKNDLHGKTSNLNEEEIEQLAEFVLSL
ncbi:MAG: beta-propeller fold lactonase family protein [Planctomycetota bacterium]